MSGGDAKITWEGDRLEVVKAFPKAIRQELGLDIRRLQLRRLQQGTMPKDSRPMKSIGQGVFELRQRDRNGWYRLIYLTRIGDTLYMLHTVLRRNLPRRVAEILLPLRADSKSFGQE